MVGIGRLKHRRLYLHPLESLDDVRQLVAFSNSALQNICVCSTETINRPGPAPDEVGGTSIPGSVAISGTDSTCLMPPAKRAKKK